MQVKTQLLIEDILCWLVIIAVVCVMLWLTSLDDEEETDFVKETKPTVTVFIKQIDGINPLVFEDCAILGEKVEC
jgi:hypothetical protein